ncbi:hypothetical protein [Leptolyngbya sp. O-77]|uniref:hypothetical protein n=1 Tax=Leptolyngbya sp. O-77 TaxID=1080068 RepID=UPI00074D311C|nr:hypothetical protein [Leptolyngbya sp. O-77]BAU42917.1 hypothetical protein O77CONTIG1_02739 [Leptolyngbya sp. O-77]
MAERADVGLGIALLMGWGKPTFRRAGDFEVWFSILQVLAELPEGRKIGSLFVKPLKYFFTKNSVFDCESCMKLAVPVTFFHVRAKKKSVPSAAAYLA